MFSEYTTQKYCLWTSQSIPLKRMRRATKNMKIHYILNEISNPMHPHTDVQRGNHTFNINIDDEIITLCILYKRQKNSRTRAVIIATIIDHELMGNKWSRIGPEVGHDRGGRRLERPNSLRIEPRARRARRGVGFI